jgi:hypothetical protein
MLPADTNGLLVENLVINLNSAINSMAQERICRLAKDREPCLFVVARTSSVLHSLIGIGSGLVVIYGLVKGQSFLDRTVSLDDKDQRRQ